MTNKAYINTLIEEGTRADLTRWIIKLDAEVDNLKEIISNALKSAEGKQTAELTARSGCTAPERCSQKGLCAYKGTTVECG